MITINNLSTYVIPCGLSVFFDDFDGSTCEAK